MAVKKTRVAITGFGRIGRLAFRELWKSKDIEVVAINDTTAPETTAHLLQYDSAQGQFMPGKISGKKGLLTVGNKTVKLVAKRDPLELPWKKLKVDVVLECTGAFRDKESASKHIKAGAKSVVISAPAKGDLPTIVYGVNHKSLTKKDKVVSGASCTTNCLAPVVDVLNKNFKVNKGFMTTIHAYTADQNLVDNKHKDLRRARAAAMNIVPTTTGAAVAVGLVLPELAGKLDGNAMRVPTVTGSVVDLVVELDKKVSVKSVNDAFKKASNATLGYSELPLVSTDIVGTKFGSIIDGLSTKVIEQDGKQLVKVVMWYDNETSYVAQLIRTVKHYAKLK